MTTATTTIEGQIVLGGDLTGSADFPELISTGVIPGVYSPVQRVYIDAKGRIVSLAPLTPTQVIPLIVTATSVTKGIFSLGPMFTLDCGAVTLVDATNAVKGRFRIGAGLKIAAGLVELDYDAFVATGSVFGFVRSGTNITNTAGVLSIADATDAVKGVFSVGAGLSANAGVVSVDLGTLPEATNSALGFVQPGANVNLNSNIISVPTATSSVRGVATYGADFTVTNGNVVIEYSPDTMPDATAVVKGKASFSASQFTVTSGNVEVNIPAVASEFVATDTAFGTVRAGGVDTNITNTSGELFVLDATTTTLGVASFNPTHFSVANGEVTDVSAVKTNTANTYTASQSGRSSAFNNGPVLSVGAVNVAPILDVTLVQNLFIGFPLPVAPAGTMVQRQIILRYNPGIAFTVTLSGTYKTNKPITFTNAASSGIDVLTILITDTDSYAILNETFL